MVYSQNNRKKGFTLIELIVVIAIIGILSAVVTTSLNSAKSKGRDAKRVTDIKQIQLALAMYYDACGRQYPNKAGGTNNAALDGGENNGCTGTTNLSSFLNPIPVNPTGGGVTGAYGYGTNAGFTDYLLQATLELNNATVLGNDVDTGNYGQTCTDSPIFYYCVGA